MASVAKAEMTSLALADWSWADVVEEDDSSSTPT